MLVFLILLSHFTRHLGGITLNVSLQLRPCTKDESLPSSFACRCNQHAVANGFDYFSLRYYGECYGANAVSVHKAYSCLSQNYESCTDSSEAECVGVDLFDYIYEVGENRSVISCVFVLWNRILYLTCSHFQFAWPSFIFAMVANEDI